MLVAYPIHFRYVKATAAGARACSKDHPKAQIKRMRHPFAHAFRRTATEEWFFADEYAALCGFKDFDDLDPLDISQTEDDGPIDWTRLICGDCLKELEVLDDESERETWESLPVIEGVKR